MIVTLKVWRFYDEVARTWGHKVTVSLPMFCAPAGGLEETSFIWGGICKADMEVSFESSALLRETA